MRAEPNVCRSPPDRGFQIGAHARRDPVGARIVRSVAGTLLPEDPRTPRPDRSRAARQPSLHRAPARPPPRPPRPAPYFGRRDPAAVHPRRRFGGPERARLTCSRHRTVFSSATAARESASTSDDRSTECTIRAFRTTERAFFDCSWPTKVPHHVRTLRRLGFQLLLAVSPPGPGLRKPPEARISLIGRFW